LINQFDDGGMITKLPVFLNGKMSLPQYREWLFKQANSIFNREGRDIRRGKLERRLYLTREELRHALHMQMLRSDGRDAYTGRALSWRLAVESLQEPSHNKERGKDGRQRLRERAMLPTFDHRFGQKRRSFRLCGAVTNHAKCYLTEKEFLLLCRDAIAHRGYLLGASVTSSGDLTATERVS
jgi:hypothetical protein